MGDESGGSSREPVAAGGVPDGSTYVDQTAAVEALSRVLGSSAFASAPRSRDLLAFVVTETLAGRGHLLNERVVSRMALGRPPSLDTRTDASARVQARRTRGLLDRYYADEGRADTLRIAIPLGQYAAAFTAASHGDTRGGHAEAAGGRPSTGGPVLAVVQLRHHPSGVERRVAAGLTEAMVANLSRFPGLSVVGPLVPGGSGTGEDDLESVGLRSGADFVLHGSVRAGDDTVRVTVHLADADSPGAGVRWSETFERPIEAFRGFEGEDDVVAHVVAAVGDIGGVLLREASRHRRGSDSRVAEALSLYYAYLDELTPETAPAVVGALHAAAELEPDNAHVIASLAFTYAVDVLMRGTAAAESMATAAELGRRALRLDNGSATANNVLGIVELARGNLPGARTYAEGALALTPFHPGNSYVAGMLLGASGEWARGIEIIRRAVRVNPYGPNHRHTLLAIDALLRDDVAEALAEASLLHFPGYLYGSLLRAVCLAELDVLDEADAELQAVLELCPDFLDRPTEVLASAPTIPDHAAEHLAVRVKELAAATGH